MSSHWPGVGLVVASCGTGPPYLPPRGSGRLKMVMSGEWFERESGAGAALDGVLDDGQRLLLY